jgi:hypothetical protein
MERGTERALRRAGHVTTLIDDRRARRLVGPRLLQRWALARAKEFNADFVLLSKCEALAPETVARIIHGRSNAMWYHDAQWYKDTDRPDIAHIVTIGKLARTFFVSGFENEWRALGLPAKFLPSCADVGITPVAPEPEFASDIAFVGTGYDPSRAAFLIEIAKKHNVRVWGRGWEEWRDSLSWSGRAVQGRDFASVCSSSKILLGVNPARYANESGNTTSDRTWMVIIAGGFYLAQGTSELTKMLGDDDHCVWYDDLASCLRQCDYYLNNAPARDRIKRQGEAFVRQYHTFDQRIHNLLSGEEFVNPLEKHSYAEPDTRGR